MLNTSYIVASALTPQVGSCTTNGNDPNLPFTNNRTNNGNQDAAGNVRWDGATIYAFDAENRITNSTRTVGSVSTAVNYKYDGDGRRVRVDVTGGASTNIVYDAGGKLIAEYGSQAYLLVAGYRRASSVAAFRAWRILLLAIHGLKPRSVQQSAFGGQRARSC